MRIKMNIQIPLIAIFTLCFNFTFAQFTFPFPSLEDEPVWHVSETYFMGSSSEAFRYEEKVSICGVDYQSVFFKDYDVNGYIRVEGEKVYGRLSTNCEDKDYLLYDFNPSLYDEFYIGNSIVFPIVKDTALVRVVKIDTIQLENISTKRIKLLYDRCNRDMLYDTLVWIRGVGATQHPFFSFRCLCDVCEVLATTTCMTLSGNLEYEDMYYDCSTIVSTRVTTQTQLEAYPNPFEDRILIRGNFDQESISLFTPDGRQITELTVTSVDGGLILEWPQSRYTGLLFLLVEGPATTQMHQLVKR